jgi:aspartate-semialdehyde dehydrogenase
MLMALAPLHREYQIRRLVISTYQSVTGTGVKAVAQLENERGGLSGEMAYPYPIDLNCIPHCDVFTDNGYTKEEMKLVNETRKIFGNGEIRVTATAVRVPVTGGHSEAVNVEFEREFDLDRVRELVSNAPGVILYDNPAENKYPMPIIAHDRDEVFVGRLRRDFSQERTLNMWVVADNIRKGAATNAVQIAEYMISAGMLK